MENIIGQYAQIATLMVAIYFVLMTISGSLNLYLRFHDHLPIDREDLQSLARNARNALLLVALTGLFRYLPFFMALGFLLCAVIIFQILKINILLKVIKD